MTANIGTATVNVTPTLSREFVAAAKQFLDTMCEPDEPAGEAAPDDDVCECAVCMHDAGFFEGRSEGIAVANQEWRSALTGVVPPGNELTPTGVAAYIKNLQVRYVESYFTAGK